MEYGALVGIYCFIGMLVLIFLQVPIFICMFLAAFVGFWLVGGPNFALTQFTNGPYHIAATYTFAVVPMFILMGVLAGECGRATWGSSSEISYSIISEYSASLSGSYTIYERLAFDFM